MKLKELIETLQEIEEAIGGDVEVRYAHQPRWAFEYSIRGAAYVEAGKDYYDFDDEDRPPIPAKKSVVYLAEGQQLNYLPGEAARALCEAGIW